MSAPDTNIETQKNRHWVPLAGIGIVAAFAAAMFLFNYVKATNGETPPSLERTLPAQSDG